MEVSSWREWREGSEEEKEEGLCAIEGDEDESSDEEVGDRGADLKWEWSMAVADLLQNKSWSPGSMLM